MSAEKKESVWLASQDYAETYGTDIMVLCPFMQMPNAKGLCLQYDENAYLGAVENEKSARRQLKAKGFISLGDL